MNALNDLGTLRELEDDGAPALRVEGVTVSFATPEGELIALQDVTFAVRSGEFVCLVGPSGCGKTTLLRTLSGLLHPGRGRIWLDGKLVTAPRRQVGIVFQSANLMPWRTVLGNVMLPLELANVPQAQVNCRARVLIELVGLGEFSNAYPAGLSGGMAQRVAIARALAHDPDVLLLDEPFGSLDALTRERMGQELLRIWHAQRKTVLMVTHSVPEAVFLADRVLVLSPRPGTIAAAVPVALPRPRHMAQLETEAFGALAGRVRAAIRAG
jgi:NitT/TauT family transport system ATP-binding protein